MPLREYIKTRDARITITGGLVLGAMALIGADRFPAAFVALGGAWVVLAVVRYRLATHRQAH